MLELRSIGDGMRVTSEVDLAGPFEPCDKVSTPTHNTDVLGAWTAQTGEVVELVRYTYSQGLHNYMYLIYEDAEVR